jgi:lichenan operon transcriptional antiterminator
MEGLLNERCKLIIKSLITKGVLTLKELKHICNVSERTISKDLDSLESLVNHYKLVLVRKPKLGIWIDGKEVDKEKLFISININNAKMPNTPKERQDYILLKLILASNYITMQELCDEIYVSRGTIENDLEIIEGVLKKAGLALKKTTNKGIKINGDEKKLRVLIADFFSKVTYVMPSKELINHLSTPRKNITEYSFEKELFDLFSDLDLKSIEKLISEAEKSLGYQFTDVAFTSLLIHLAIAIKRMRSNNEVKLTEVILNNLESTKEYEVAKSLAKSIENIFNITLPKTECGYIAIHILGAKVQYNLLDKNEEFLKELEFHGDIENLCKSMIYKASQVLDLDFTEDMILIKGLSMHIRAAINRFLHDIPIKNPLLDNIKNSFIASFEAAVASSEVIKETYKVNVDENEIAYIALHFEAARERMINDRSIKKKVLLVCSSGIGTSQLAASKLKRVFDNVEIIDVISSQNLKDKCLSGVDLIITTIPLMITDVPVIRVNPLLLEEDIENIKSFMSKNNSVLSNKKNDIEEVMKLIDKDLILVRENFSSKEEVIRELSRIMVIKGYVEEDFNMSVLDREKIASTATGRIALPHGNMDKVRKSVIGICTLNKKIDWYESKVDFIIMLAIKKNDVLKMQNIFDGLYDIISDGKLTSKIVNCNSKKEISNLIFT